jgi:hypothetical protein
MWCGSSRQNRQRSLLTIDSQVLDLQDQPLQRRAQQLRRLVRLEVAVVQGARVEVEAHARLDTASTTAASSTATSTMKERESVVSGAAAVLVWMSPQAVHTVSKSGQSYAQTCRTVAALPGSAY